MNAAYYTLLNQAFGLDLNGLDQNFEQLENSLREYLKKWAGICFSELRDDFKEELIQQTWIIVWLKAKDCKGCTQKSILRWIKKIIYHTGINLLRDNQKFESFIDIESGHAHGDEQAAENEPSDSRIDTLSKAHHSIRAVEDQAILQERIEKCMKKLTPQGRKVFLLCLSGYSKTEIAQRLMISNPRVTQYVDQIADKY